MICIKGGRIMNPATGYNEINDLYIKDGAIAAIGAMPEGEKISETIRARGMVVAPGLVDVHVHFRDPGFTWKEGRFRSMRRIGETSAGSMPEKKCPVFFPMNAAPEMRSCSRS